MEYDSLQEADLAQSPTSYSAAPANVQPVANASSPASAATASGQGSSNTANAAPANNGSVLTVKAPMPGTVIAFKVIVGQKVKRGDVLLLRGYENGE